MGFLLGRIPEEGPISPLLNVSEEWSEQRNSIYEENRNVFLTHFVRPSSKQGQRFDVYIYLIRHEGNGFTPDDFSDVLGANFFLGKYWGNEIFSAEEQHGFIGISTAASGTALCTCQVTFTDNKKINLNRYIDFEAERTGGSTH